MCQHEEALSALVDVIVTNRRAPKGWPRISVAQLQEFQSLELRRHAEQCGDMPITPLILDGETG